MTFGGFEGLGREHGVGKSETVAFRVVSYEPPCSRPGALRVARAIVERVIPFDPADTVARWYRGGTRPRLDHHLPAIRALVAQGVAKIEIARRLGISANSVSRILERAQSAPGSPGGT